MRQKKLKIVKILFQKRICTFVLRDAQLTTIMSNLSMNAPSISDGSPGENNIIIRTFPSKILLKKSQIVLPTKNG